jgi:Tfp pilus assembly protein PilF
MDRIQKLKDFLIDSPKDNFLRHALALEYIKLGDDVSAEKLFKEILNETPDYIGSYYHIAKLLERMGKTEEAIIYYEKGMEVAKKLKDNHSFNELQAAYDDLVD